MIDVIKDNVALLSLAAGMGIVVALLNVTTAIFSQRLIDDILPHKNYAKLFYSIGFVFVLLIIRELITLLRQNFLLGHSQKINIKITRFFYGHLLKLPIVFFNTRRIGELTTRLNDTARIQRAITSIGGSLTVDIFTIIITLSLLFNYSFNVGLVCLFFLPVYFVLMRKNNNKIKAGQQMVMVNDALAEANYISTLQGISAIKDYNKQELFIDIGTNYYERYQKSVIGLGKAQIRFSFLANLVGIFFLVSILLYTSLQVLSGNLKIGELMAIASASIALLPSVSSLALVLVSFNEARVAIERMFAFTTINKETESGVSIKTLDFLNVKDLSYRFTGHQLLLNKVSFSVKKGEMIAIIGDNGSGKSTIAKLLQHAYKYEQGSITINEAVELNAASICSWRKIISIVPQQVHVFNGTILENIFFDDLKTKSGLVSSFIKDHGFDNFLNSLPQSYQTVVGEDGVRLSGGQLQMIGIMRALYNNPSLLIMDEATSAMDKESENFVFDLLANCKKEMAIIIITHKLENLNDCDRIFTLEKGKMQIYNTHEMMLQ